MGMAGLTAIASEVAMFHELSNEERMEVLAMPDFLNRVRCPVLPSREVSENIFLAMHEGEKLTASVQVTDEAWVAYREIDGRREVHQPGSGIIDFPVTPDCDGDAWKAMISAAEEFLSGRDRMWAAVYCPVDCQQARETLAELRYSIVGYCELEDVKKAYGFRGTVAVFVKNISRKVASGFIDLFPYCRTSSVKTSATASTAPGPDEVFWSNASLYSGFSSYPFFEDLLMNMIGAERIRRLLTAPCATGDVLRFLPGNQDYEKVVGMDITETSLRFARKRLENPAMDVVNRFMIQLFYENALTSTVSDSQLLGIIMDITESLGRQISDAQAESVLSQMKAAFMTCIKNSVVADFWILLKGIAGLAFQRELIAGNRTHPLDLIPRLFECQSFTSRIYSLLAQHDNWNQLLERTQKFGETGYRLLKEGKVDLRCQNILDVREGERGYFDCIFIFEALLMFHAAGKQGTFLEAMAHRLSPGGVIVLTGIRNRNGGIPVELQKAERSLRQMGLRSHSFSARIKPRCLVHAGMKDQVTPVLYAKMPD